MIQNWMKTSEIKICNREVFCDGLIFLPATTLSVESSRQYCITRLLRFCGLIRTHAFRHKDNFICIFIHEVFRQQLFVFLLHLVIENLNLLWFFWILVQSLHSIHIIMFSIEYKISWVKWDGRQLLRSQSRGKWWLYYFLLALFLLKKYKVSSLYGGHTVEKRSSNSCNNKIKMSKQC